jgi:hypothetical protein
MPGLIRYTVKILHEVTKYVSRNVFIERISYYNRQPQKKRQEIKYFYDEKSGQY